MNYCWIFDYIIYNFIGLITGISSGVLSYKDKLVWTIVGAKDLFHSQELLDTLTKQYMAEEFAQLQFAAGNEIISQQT